jgi:polar amino acid transport system substrate-binding protein
MVTGFVNGLLSDGKAPIPFEDIVAVTKASFKVLESIKRGGQQVDI